MPQYTFPADLMEFLPEPFPVGSVFIAVVDTDPATLLGYGTWSAFGAGKMLVGIDSGDVDFDTVEETGGSKTHDHADHSDLSHSGTAVGDHSDHVHNGPAFHGGETISATSDPPVALTPGSSAASVSHTHTVPTLSHGDTGNPTSTLAHSVTQPSDHTISAHSSESNVPPYIVVYMWKRTA
jgi:hypothetical protein